MACPPGGCSVNRAPADRDNLLNTSVGNAEVGAVQALQNAKNFSDQASDREFEAQQLESKAACNADQAEAQNQRNDAQTKRKEAKELREKAEREIAQAKTNADSAAKNLAQQKALDGECDSNSGGSNNQGQGKSPMMPPPSSPQKQDQKKEDKKDEPPAQPSMMPQQNAFKGLDPAQELAKESKPPSAIPDWAKTSGLADFRVPFNGKTAR